MSRALATARERSPFILSRFARRAAMIALLFGLLGAAIPAYYSVDDLSPTNIFRRAWSTRAFSHQPEPFDRFAGPQLRAALDKPFVSRASTQTTLGEAIDELEHFIGSSIRVDWNALSNGGVMRTSPLKLEAGDYAASGVLHLMRFQFPELSWYARDEDGIVVTTRADAINRFARFQAASLNDLGELFDTEDDSEVMHRLKNLIGPETWESHGIQASIVGDGLVVLDAPTAAVSGISLDRLRLMRACRNRVRANASTIAISSSLCASIGAGLYAAWIKMRRSRVEEQSRCPACGYDLRATPARCPECGTRSTSSGQAAAKSDQIGITPPCRQAGINTDEH